MTLGPVQLKPVFHEKVWGSRRLEPWFAPHSEKIGEVSFTGPGGSSLPLMVKFLFTSERLSVQVHPDDAYALAHEGRLGKSEMWYVLAAEPDAKLAAGFREPVTRERIREAAASGEIEQLLQWWPVSPGQVFFVPAGTVHTLGAGVSVCEIQQDNQITYRLYDYGRNRELHLDKALDVIRPAEHSGPLSPESPVLVSCPAFAVERLDVTDLMYESEPSRFHLLAVVEGSGRIGTEPLVPGQVWYVPPSAEPFRLAADGRAVVLKSYIPTPFKESRACDNS